jgi:hypothetical protein
MSESACQHAGISGDRVRERVQQANRELLAHGTFHGRIQGLACRQRSLVLCNRDRQTLGPDGPSTTVGRRQLPICGGIGLPVLCPLHDDGDGCCDDEGREVGDRRFFIATV